MSKYKKSQCATSVAEYITFESIAHFYQLVTWNNIP